MCCFIVISLPSFRSQNNLDRWYQSSLLLVVSQSISPTRSGNRELGLELVSLEDNRSCQPRRPPMAEEKRDDEA
jgi:hypothetical protein